MKGNSKPKTDELYTGLTQTRERKRTTRFYLLEWKFCFVLFYLLYCSFFQFMATRCIKKKVFARRGLFETAHFFPHIWLGSAEIGLDAQMPSFDSICCSCNPTLAGFKGGWEWLSWAKVQTPIRHSFHFFFGVEKVSVAFILKFLNNHVIDSPIFFKCKASAKSWFILYVPSRHNSLSFLM